MQSTNRSVDQPDDEGGSDANNSSNNNSNNNLVDAYLDSYICSLLAHQEDRNHTNLSTSGTHSREVSLDNDDHDNLNQAVCMQSHRPTPRIGVNSRPVQKRTQKSANRHFLRSLKHHHSVPEQSQTQRSRDDAPREKIEHHDSYCQQQSNPDHRTGSQFETVDATSPVLSVVDVVNVDQKSIPDSTQLDDKYASDPDNPQHVVKHDGIQEPAQQLATKNHSTAVVRRPTSHTARCRAKVNSKFAELLTILPPPPPNVSIRHKAQVLQYTCSVLESISARQRALEAELTLSSAERMKAWISENVACRRSLLDALDPVLRLIMSRTNWKCGDIWLPELNSIDNIPVGSFGASFPPLRFSLGVVQDGKPRSDPLYQFNQYCRDFILRPPAGVPGRVYVTGRPEWLARIADPPTFERAALARNLGVVACLALPIIARGKVIAILVVYDTCSREYDDQVVAMAESIIGAVNDAILSLQASSGRAIAHSDDTTQQ